MKRYRRWMAGLLTAAVITTASISCGLAAHAETPFAEFRIDASGMDKPERSISVDIYRPDDSGRFQVDSSSEYVCRLNRATKDAGLFIQANTKGVWVSVDYLTDVNNDGVYELLEDPDAPVWDVMDTKGVLARLAPENPAPTLTVGQPYILSPELLVYRSQKAVQDRQSGGPCALDVAQDPAPRQFPLCLVRLHLTDPANGQDDTQTYYLQIYDDVLIPFDVSPTDWYYDAVAFGLSQGYFAGTSDGYFLPNSQLPRSQMAQVLWAMAGSPELSDTKGSQFTDVSPDDWFYPAVAWCEKNELISGYNPNTFGPGDLLTREQMATILRQYARYSGTSLRCTADLSQFTDADDISSWAVENMRWAVTNGLISSSSETLRPKDIVTRAELASALYYYTLNAGLNGHGII